MKFSVDDIKSRLFAYTPNLKQSWILLVVITVCVVIVLIAADQAIEVAFSDCDADTEWSEWTHSLYHVYSYSDVYCDGFESGVILSNCLFVEWGILLFECLLGALVAVAVVILGRNSGYVPVMPPRQPPLLWLALVPFTLSVGMAADMLTMWIPDIMEASFKTYLPTFISIVIVTPLLEEWLFRGIILKGLLTHYSPLKAIVWSSVMFGMMHIEPRVVVFAFCIGMTVGWIYWRTRSLWPCIFIHAINNAFAFYALEKPSFAELIGNYFIAITIALFVCVLTGTWIKNNIVSCDMTSDM